jgi:hypothetical protein
MMMEMKREAGGEKLRHQPGQAVFKTIFAEDIDWKTFAAFPTGVRLAVLIGEPSTEGPYVIRVKVPRDVKLMPHIHPEDRVYTVISGVFYIGLGDRFDADKLQAVSAGSRYRPAWQHPPLSLGQIRRLCHPGKCDWASWPSLREPDGRSSQRVAWIMNFDRLCLC